MTRLARAPEREVSPDDPALLAQTDDARPADIGLERADRPLWWTQVGLIVAGLWIYDYIANLSPLRRAAGLANGMAILRLEERLYINPELVLNQVLVAHQSVGRVLADYYNLAHFVVTFAILGWVYWKHPSHFRMLRNALIVMNAIGMVVYWLYPVAPPRMLASVGYVDIGVVTHSFGSATQNATIAAHANEFAAMPSLHVAWALWCVFAVWTIWRSSLGRALVSLHFVATSVVIMATANHYLLDVVAGAATGAIGIVVAKAWARRVPGSPLLPRRPVLDGHRHVLEVFGVARGNASRRYRSRGSDETVSLGKGDPAPGRLTTPGSGKPSLVTADRKDHEPGNERARPVHFIGTQTSGDLLDVDPGGRERLPSLDQGVDPVGGGTTA